MSKPRVLAVASAGGHWQQLMLLAPSFTGTDATYATTDPKMAERSGVTARRLSDCSKSTPFRALKCAAELAMILLKVRPDVVISTGALPGVLALILGKLTGARTIWIDSIANAEEFSASGRAARRFADLWLSQWEDVAAPSGALWKGAVL
jgi:UDP-N-acetylglucosamine:LPS N-acetylglucosamine transferase